MIWINGILGVLLIAGAIFGWVFLRRRLQGDDTPLFSALKRKSERNRDDPNEIDAFIAAYRSGQAVPSDLLPGKTADEQAIPAGTRAAVHTASPVAPTTRNSALAPPATIAAVANTAPPKSPGAFLRPEVKLAYLIFRSGLRDHHVFANVRLGDLGYGTAVGKVDLLVCDSSFKYVAFIDVYTGEPAQDVPKSMFLGRIGVKHLSLSSSAMPKPGQLRELIYGEPTN